MTESIHYCSKCGAEFQKPEAALECSKSHCKSPRVALTAYTMAVVVCAALWGVTACIIFR